MTFMLRSLLAALSVVVCAGAALAACEDVENGLGVYFDEGIWEQDCFVAPVGTLFTMYVVLRNPTMPALAGFEFDWRIADAPATLFTTACHVPGTIDWWACENFHIGYTQPRPAEETMVLVELTLVTTAFLDDMFAVQAGPASPSSLPGFPAIAGGDPLEILPMNFCEGEPDAEGWSTPGLATVTSLECEGVPVESMAWSSIKTLYR